MADIAGPSRRAVLTLGSTGVVGGALALAGCAPAADPPSDSEPASTTPSPAPEPTLENPSESDGADEPATGEDVAALADVPVGGSIDATIAGAPALIAQPTAGQVVAFSAICTHQGCVVAAAGTELDCPCHGSKFDAATGEVLNGPALEPLSAIQVSVSGDRIVAASYMPEIDYTFQGLPLHVLLVHVVVIAVPAIAVLLVVIAAWPAARRVLWIPALIAAVLLVPIGLITVEAGEWLEERVPSAPLIEVHTDMGEDIVPWLWAVAVVATLIAAWQVICTVLERRATESGSAALPRSLIVVVGVVLTIAAVAVAVGSIWTVVQIGESGTRAVWEGSFSDTPLED